MNKKKALLALVCAVSLVVATFVGTMAYFTDTESVTNTFTVGKVKINLDEKDFDSDTNTEDNVKVNNETRDKANTYHLVPGVPVEKDPQVTVLADSENSYVRMMVEVERLDILEAALPVANNPDYYSKYSLVKNNTTEEIELFLVQNLVKGWDKDTWKFVGYTESVENSTEGTDAVVKKTGVYEFRYKEMVESPETDTRLPKLFETVVLPGEDFTSDNTPGLENVKIIVTAHAIQAAGFDTPELAWSNWPNN